MSAVVVVGAQWGDEGKGKVVDLYAADADQVVRYGGGANAGHTLVVGGEQVIDVNARVVAATNRDLEAEVEARRFRQDLFYRLNVMILRVPPLRDRVSDLAELADHFLESACERFGMRRKRLFVIMFIA